MNVPWQNYIKIMNLQEKIVGSHRQYQTSLILVFANRWPKDVENRLIFFYIKELVASVGSLHQTISHRFLNNFSTMSQSLAIFGNRCELSFGVN